MPFDGHRNCAGEVRCAECKQLRKQGCRHALCPLAQVAGGGQVVADQRPVAILRWTEEGELQLGMFGDGIRMLVVDERAPHDRVYEVTHREPLKALDALIPPGTEIGHAADERHDALVARMTALFEGKPHLQVIASNPGQGSSAT